MMDAFRIAVCTLIVVGLAACGEGKPKAPVEQPSVQGIDPCALVEDSELRKLFGRKPGRGVFKELGSGVRQCAWPAGGTPEFIVQLGPSIKSGVRGAVAIGEHFLVLDVPDRKAAVSVLNPNPGSGLKPFVGILAVDVPGGLLRLAPIGLAVEQDTGAYETLLAIAESASERLR